MDQSSGSWIWDPSRSLYYRYDSNASQYIYEDGTRFDSSGEKIYPKSYNSTAGSSRPRQIPRVQGVEDSVEQEEPEEPADYSVISQRAEDLNLSTSDPDILHNYAQGSGGSAYGQANAIASTELVNQRLILGSSHNASDQELPSLYGEDSEPEPEPEPEPDHPDSDPDKKDPHNPNSANGPKRPSKGSKFKFPSSGDAGRNQSTWTQSEDSSELDRKGKHRKHSSGRKR